MNELRIIVSNGIVYMTYNHGFLLVNRFTELPDSMKILIRTLAYDKDCEVTVNMDCPTYDMGVILWKNW